jgi:hypothetical protein
MWVLPVLFFVAVSASSLPEENGYTINSYMLTKSKGQPQQARSGTSDQPRSVWGLYGSAGTSR